MMAPKARGTSLVNQAIIQARVMNCDLPARYFISQQILFEKLDQKLVDDVLTEIDQSERINTHDDHIYHGRIYHCLRKTLAILCSIGHAPQIYEFCKHSSLHDRDLPFSKDQLYPFLTNDYNLVDRFYSIQYTFLPVVLKEKEMRNPQLLDELEIVPIIKSELGAFGVCGTVSKIKIHPEYDQLIWMPALDEEKVCLNPDLEMQNKLLRVCCLTILARVRTDQA